MVSTKNDNDQFNNYYDYHQQQHNSNDRNDDIDVERILQMKSTGLTPDKLDFPQFIIQMARTTTTPSKNEEKKDEEDRLYDEDEWTSGGNPQNYGEASSNGPFASKANCCIKDTCNDASTSHDMVQSNQAKATLLPHDDDNVTISFSSSAPSTPMNHKHNNNSFQSLFLFSPQVEGTNANYSVCRSSNNNSNNNSQTTKDMERRNNKRERSSQKDSQDENDYINNPLWTTTSFMSSSCPWWKNNNKIKSSHHDKMLSSPGGGPLLLSFDQHNVMYVSHQPPPLPPLPKKMMQKQTPLKQPHQHQQQQNNVKRQTQEQIVVCTTATTATSDQQQVQQHHQQQQEHNKTNTPQQLPPYFGTSTTNATSKEVVGGGGGERNEVKCTCKKSKCLKLYCDCFAASINCNPTKCQCIECKNNVLYSQEQSMARNVILEKNKEAFILRQLKLTKAEKIQFKNGGTSKCNCKKSKCLKKYCECFFSGMLCHSLCKCRDCNNFSNSNNIKSMVSGKSTFIKNAINPQNSNCGSVGSVIAAATTTITTTRPPPPLVQNITQPFATKNHNVLQQQQGQGLRHNVSMAQGYGK